MTSPDLIEKVSEIINRDRVVARAAISVVLQEFVADIDSTANAYERDELDELRYSLGGRTVENIKIFARASGIDLEEPNA